MHRNNYLKKSITQSHRYQNGLAFAVEIVASRFRELLMHGICGLLWADKPDFSLYEYVNQAKTILAKSSTSHNSKIGEIEL
jgi:hypothetical protein